MITFTILWAVWFKIFSNIDQIFDQDIMRRKKQKKLQGIIKLKIGI
jgi:hypothetical protein